MIPFMLTLIVVIGGTFLLLYLLEMERMEQDLYSEAQKTAYSVLAVQSICCEGWDALFADADHPDSLVYRQLNPGTTVQQYIDRFNRLGQSVVKRTSDRPRNPEMAPDEWEREALAAFKADPSLKDRCEKIGDGQQVFRYAIPVVVEESCLQCHGEPRGELDPTGYAKEGLRLGELKGIVSVAIPLNSTARGAASHVLFFVVLSTAIILFTWFTGQRMVKTLKDLANTDRLTQVANRNMFYTRLKEEIKWALRRRAPLALIIIDIDYFKAINDRFGHLAGDEVLKQLATLIQGSLRKGDLLARVGGEEFVIIAPNTGVQGAYQMAERIRKLVEKHRFVYETKINEKKTVYERCWIPLTISAGVAALDHACQDADEAGTILTKHADKALYQAKHNGRNRVEMYTGDNDSSND